MGAVIDLGDATPVPSPPESEDHSIAARDLDYVRTLDGDEYLNALAAVCDPDIEAAFGDDLERHGWTYAVEEGRGRRSLAVVRPRRRADLEVGGFGKLRLRFNDPLPPTDLSVTDVRFVEADHRTIRHDVVEDVGGRLRRGVGLYLMLGLSRVFVLTATIGPATGSRSTACAWRTVRSAALRSV